LFWVVKTNKLLVDWAARVREHDFVHVGTKRLYHRISSVN
jgi:hypothetical protein